MEEEEEYKIPELIDKQTKKEKVNIKSFKTKRIIGKGSYAQVVLVRKKDNNKVYAMKILMKSRMKKVKQKLNVVIERNILVGINHPFVIKMKYAFQTKDCLYFVLHYCPGGELFNLLSMRREFTEEQSRFYLA